MSWEGGLDEEKRDKEEGKEELDIGKGEEEEEGEVEKEK